MAALQINCPTCNALVEVATVTPGKTLRCPTCQGYFYLRPRLAPLTASPAPPTAAPAATPPLPQTVRGIKQTLTAAGAESGRAATHFAKIAVREGRETAVTTAAQAVRLVQFGIGHWHGIRLKGDALSSLTNLGARLVQAGLGDAGLRQQLCQLDTRIANLHAAKARTGALEAERRAFLARIAEPFVTQPAPPGLELEHGHAVATAGAIGAHTVRMNASRTVLLPTDRRDLLRLAIGSGTAVLLLAGLGWAMRSPSRNSSPADLKTTDDPDGGDVVSGSGVSHDVLPAQTEAVLPRGSQQCQACFGTGQQTCPYCSGTAQTLCLSCNGSGRARSGNATISCFTCNGSGRQRCTNGTCNSGRVQCVQCGGLGHR